MRTPPKQSASAAAGTSNSGLTLSRKRKARAPLEHDADQSNYPEQLEGEENPSKAKRRKKSEAGEKRLRRFVLPISSYWIRIRSHATSDLVLVLTTIHAPRFRARPPQNFHVVYERATSQRFYVLGRTRAGTAHCPEESVELTGSTGNIYFVHVARLPTCTCPHASKGHQCKHVLYVLSRVLRARFDLVYQLALLTTELQEIFTNAPPIESADPNKKTDKNRKTLEGDCPICYMPFEDAEDTVYCRATCGQNIHKECFEMWAATKRKSAGDQVTCPMCRTPWQGDDDILKKIKNKTVVGSDGYVNVANELGISRHRAPITMGRVEAHGIGNSTKSLDC
ncbi:hypothetical protein AAE478_009088 [Parahypoxylon ruwenzoriense]